MKKVLFAIPTLGGGGAERVLVTLLNNLDKNKYDITLFSIFDGGINKKYINENIEYRFYFTKLFRGNSHLFKLFSPKKLYKMMIRDEYDIAISYLEGPTTRIISGCPYRNSKLLNWVHTEVLNPNIITKSYRSPKEAVACYNKFEATIFVSNAAQSAFIKTFENVKENMMVKYNTLDDKLIESNSKEKIDDIIIDNNKTNLVSVGRFTEEKGYERLIKIMDLLVKDNLNVHLFLLGEGKLVNKCHRIIDKLGLENYVTMLGFKDNPYKYVRNCDLFICSSYREGYSTAVTESLIVGTPVVTTACSGMEEILGKNNEYGLITDNDDASLYDGISRMLTEPGLLMHYKKKAIERRSFFSTKKTVEEVEKLLDNLKF